MYRYVEEEQRPSIRAIATLVHQENPRMFEAIKRIRPHVSILAIKAVKSVSSRCDPVLKGQVEALPKRIYNELQPEAPAMILASCVSVDYFKNSLAIVVDDPALSFEMDHAITSLESVIGRQIAGLRSPHITLGNVSENASPDLRDEILGCAAEVCSIYLPGDRIMALGSISLARPRQ